MTPIEGVIPALLTPFRKGDESVDEDGLRTLCDFLIEKGVHGLFPCGTAGEGPVLSLHERKHIAEIVVDQVRHRLPVIVHTGFVNTASTIDLTVHAGQIGAYAAAVVAPYYYSHDDHSLIQHFVEVAEATPDLPIYLYNIPQSAKNNIAPRVLAEVAKVAKNVIGIKDSSGDLVQLQGYTQVMGEEFDVFIGSDPLSLAGLALGCRGVVSSLANAFPELSVGLYRAFREGDYRAALQTQRLITRLRSVLRGSGPNNAPYKKVLELRGIEIGGARRPLRELLPEETDRLRKSLKQVGMETWLGNLLSID